MGSLLAHKQVVLAGASCNWAVEEALGGKDLIEIVRSPIVAAKAIKNSVELEGFRQCHIRDAVALVRRDELVA